MNIQLDPPRVPPLDPARRSQLRNRVMDQSMSRRDHSARRWIAPVVAVAAVAAVVAGTLVITSRPSPGPAVAGSPQQTAAPRRADFDLGAVPHKDLADLSRKCTFEGEQASGTTLLWSRRVRGATTGSTTTVALARNSTAAHSPGQKQGFRICAMRTLAGQLGAVGWTPIIADKTGTAHPTPAQGLVTLGAIERELSADKTTLQSWAFYRARPEIARVESRSVWQGKAGEWTEGVVDGGYAYTQVEIHGRFGAGDHLEQEVRAFDAAGKPVPVKL
jgi:hypothetical protein